MIRLDVTYVLLLPVQHNHISHRSLVYIQLCLVRSSPSPPQTRLDCRVESRRVVSGSVYIGLLTVGSRDPVSQFCNQLDRDEFSTCSVFSFSTKSIVIYLRIRYTPPTQLNSTQQLSRVGAVYWALSLWCTAWCQRVCASYLAVLLYMSPVCDCRFSLVHLPPRIKLISASAKVICKCNKPGPG